MERKEKRPEQLNLRISQTYQDILDAVVFLDETGQSALARRVIEDYLDGRARGEDVQQLLALRAGVRARKGGKIAEFKRAPKKS